MAGFVEMNHVYKRYQMGEVTITALSDVNFSIQQGEFVVIVGPSGAGKTTLLNLLSTLDKPTKGEILLEGKDITKLSNKQLSLIRRDKIGFIFQEYNLLDNMTLQDNIALPLSLNGAKSGEIIRKVQQRACAFGLESHLRKYPYQLSGG